MVKQKRKQRLAESLAEEATGIDISVLQGGRRPSPPQQLSPEEQQARDDAFSRRFVAPGPLRVQGQFDTLSDIDRVSSFDTVSESNTVSEIDTVSKTETVSNIDTVSKNDTVSHSDRVDAPGISSLSPPPRTRQPKKPTALKPAAGDVTIAQILARNGNQPVTLGSGYTAVVWAVDDVMATHQTPAEQTAYRHLYRLSYGFGNTHCFVGYDTLCKRCQMTTNTLKRALASLVAKKHIATLENVNTRTHKATVYRVFLPEDIKGLQNELEAYRSQGNKSSGDGGDTVSNIDTVSTTDTVSIADTVSQNTQDTLSKIDTAYSRTKKDSRTDIDLLTNPIDKTSYVRSGRGLAEGLVETPKYQNRVREEEDYIYSRPTMEQGEIFDAQFAWERCFPDQPLPKAAKLNEWLETIRQRDRKGGELLAVFEGALRWTLEKEPRDVQGWLTAGFREGYLIDEAIRSA